MAHAGTGRSDFFVSYTATDEVWAEWIAWVLEEAGYSVVLQKWDYRPGSNFVRQMNQAAEQTERTLAVLSPEYEASKFTETEWTAAFADDPTGETGNLVPVRVKAFVPSGIWKPLVYVDLVGLGESQARDVLLAGMEKRRTKPPSRPSFPGPAGQIERVVSEAPQFPSPQPKSPVRTVEILGAKPDGAIAHYDYEAPLEQVFEVLTDVGKYPAWDRHARSAEVKQRYEEPPNQGLPKTVDWKVKSQIVNVWTEYTADYEYHKPHRMAWDTVPTGRLYGPMSGSYTLVSHVDPHWTRVTFELHGEHKPWIKFSNRKKLDLHYKEVRRRLEVLGKRLQKLGHQQPV